MWTDRRMVEPIVRLLAERLRDPSLAKRAMIEYEAVLQAFRDQVDDRSFPLLRSDGATVSATLAAVLVRDAMGEVEGYVPLHRKGRRRRMVGAVENDLYYMLADAGYKLHKYTAVLTECVMLHPT